MYYVYNYIYICMYYVYIYMRYIYIYMCWCRFPSNFEHVGHISGLASVPGETRVDLTHHWLSSTW